MRLDGFGIFVKDMATMVRFYRDVLNFEIREDENASKKSYPKGQSLFWSLLPSLGANAHVISLTRKAT